jgi:hypothetical protein
MEVYDEEEDMVYINGIGSGFIIYFGKRFRRVGVLGTPDVSQCKYLAKSRRVFQRFDVQLHMAGEQCQLHKRWQAAVKSDESCEQQV